MSKITITYFDYVNCKIFGLPKEYMDLFYKTFRAFVPSARYSTKYKMGVWNGYIEFLSRDTGRTYVNLLPVIKQALGDKFEIEEVYPSDRIIEPKFTPIDKNYFSHICWPEGHKLEGQPIILQEHQVEIVNKCLENIRSTISAATSAGKTLVSAVLASEVSKYGRFMMVLPSADLINQTYDLFKLLKLDVGIVGLGKRELDKRIMLCTWQTLTSVKRRMNDKKLKLEDKQLSSEELKKVLNGTIGVLCDEVHCISGDEIKKLFGQTLNKLPIRWGLTGTIPKEDVNYLSLVTSIGPVVHKLEPKELQEKHILADCDITCIKLKDDLVFRTYSDEISYLSGDERRLTFISELIKGIVSKQGNTLVLINRVKQGKDLEKILLDMGVDVVFLSGKDKNEKRKEEYKKINTENNKCIIATYQIASTGLDIPRLFNLVMIDGGKSYTKVIQSIGRLLRTAKDKSRGDIFDVFSTTTFSKRQFRQRCKFYNEKQYPYKLLEINKWK